MSSWKDKKRKHWCYHFQYLGRRYYGRGFKNRHDADAEEAIRRKKIIALIADREEISTVMDFLEVANEYLDYARVRFAKSTYKDKSRCYGHFAEYLRSLPDPITIYDITPRIVLAFLNKRPSANNFNVYRKELSALFTYIINVLQMEVKNPCKPIEKIPYTPPPKRVMTEEEFIKIMIAATPEEQDLLFIVALSVARIDEILRLRWSDVNFDTRVVTKWTAKRKGGSYEPIHVPMGEDLYVVLWKRWKARVQEEWVFYNEKTETRYMHRPKLMASVCKRAGIEPLKATRRRKPVWDKEHKRRTYVEDDASLYYGFHDIRHFIATYMNDKLKASTSVVQKYLGHKDERTTQIYLHLFDSRLREVATSLDGKFTEKIDECLPKVSTREREGYHEST